MARVVALFAGLSLVLAGCGDDASGPNAADRAFLQRMIPHHDRAIAVARIGERLGTDPRVRAFAARIVREQSPELATMRHSARGQELDLAVGARTAEHRITDAQVAALRQLHGAAFDEQFLRLHITSENGAASMARAEVRGGDDAASLKLARNMATAPTTQIPELRNLLAALGG